MPDLSLNITKEFNSMNIEYDENKISKINDYLNLLDKWNKAYNLTAVRNINEMLERHVVDSLSIAAYITGNRFIDVGTGAGLPGIPLAIMNPDNYYVLLDSNGKKTRFLQQVKTELGLPNIEIVNTRVEQYRTVELFDGVLSRAFSSIDDMLKNTQHLCKGKGHFFAMKGQFPQTELQLITKPYKVQTIDLPDNQFERHLVIISQSA